MFFNSLLKINKANAKSSKTNRSNSIIGSNNNKDSKAIPKSNYRNSQITNSKNTLANKSKINTENKAEEDDYPQETRGKSRSVISSINPRKAVLHKDLLSKENFKVEEAKSIMRHSSFGDFNGEFADAQVSGI